MKIYRVLLAGMWAAALFVSPMAGRAQVVSSKPVGAVRLPHIFGDHMVLQRDLAVPVWGWADAGEKITVEFAGQKKTVAADAAGRWMVRLDAMPASAESRKLVVISANIRREFDDVLVGEVWLCSGQSNMEFTMGGSSEAKEDIPAANYPLIRHIAIPKVTSAVPKDDVTADWKVCSPSTAAGFTAAGYFFAVEIHKQLNVPVGLIHSSWGGTLIEPWTTPEGFTLAPTLEGIHQRVVMANSQSPEYKAKLREVIGKTETWLDKTKKLLTEPGTVEPMPAMPPGLESLTKNSDPCALFNAMIHPLVPFGIRGALWYQGESNHFDGKLYTDKMLALIEGWRKIWGEGPFPFYYVQIAPYKYGEEEPGVIPVFWEAQAAAQAITNTGMVVINDIGNINDIHPKNKKEVGRRLALQALAKTYGKAGIVWSGPTFKSLKPEGAQLRVTFDHAEGLKTRDGKAPSHFEIIGPETDFVAADAKIDGDSVLLSSPACPAPVAVRYAWNKIAEPNLCNGAGLPVGAFRAGQIPRIDQLNKIPEAKDFKPVYDLDLAKLGGVIKYDENNAAAAPRFDRVAYFIELKKNGEPSHYLYVSMDAFTPDAKMLGVPVFGSHIFFQTAVSNLTVLSDVAGIKTGEHLGTGNIEFWPDNYGPFNSGKVPGADDAVWDFGDQPSDPKNGYGSMQVHNTGAKQTLVAVNNWNAGSGADLGIGNSAGKTLDWTFTANAGSYTSKRLRVLVHPAP